MPAKKSSEPAPDAPEVAADESVNPTAAAVGDRVAMLSLRADGTPDQHNPELIGDKDAALAATKRQFAEQAVAAHDTAQPGETAETVEQDPAIAERQQEHDRVVSDAEELAESVVDELHKG